MTVRLFLLRSWKLVNFCCQAEHENVKTVYFATDCIEDMHVWMHAMNQAATMQLPPGYLPLMLCVLIGTERTNLLG